MLLSQVRTIAHDVNQVAPNQTSIARRSMSVLARNERAGEVAACPLLTGERTCRGRRLRSENDPKRTSVLRSRTPAEGRVWPFVVGLAHIGGVGCGFFLIYLCVFVRAAAT